ncbi:MAG: hypothetical protein N5P05_001788 [Chroococcopsis gigantea SAG 12.99]|jgi:hypothetical protein|nr:hypothetical protein [Chroococcopsis gigantea SAG 12.99]
MKGNKKQKADGELRASQIISTFGAGAMVDLPDHSVIIAGLSFWRGEREPIPEERLQKKVAALLDRPNIKLYSPPRQFSSPTAAMATIDTFVFPTWFLAQVEQTFIRKGKEYRTRPLIRWGAIANGKVKLDGKTFPVVPVRFVQACINGHLSDIDWYAFVHQGKQCLGQLWLDEGGSGNDFEEIFVRCEACRQSRPLSMAKVPNSRVLGSCQGHRPWLGVKGQESCISYRIDDKTGQLVPDPNGKPEINRLLVRSATNAYFSQTLSVISLPDPDEQLRREIDRFYDDDLQYEESMGDLAKQLKKPKFADLVKFPIEVVWAEIQRRKSGQTAQEKTIKQVEFEALVNADAKDNYEDFKTFPRSLEELPGKWKPYIDRIVLVHRLREVIAQIGFTRFDAYLPNIDGELDDLGLNVRLAALDFEKEWLPAIENKGEGVFIAFNKELIDDWKEREAVKARSKSLIKGFEEWLSSRGIPPEQVRLFPGIPYIMLHSLSHLLITSVSLECGYAASAIRERIYVNDLGYGILLYTGTSGSEGTLGGLVEVGKQIEFHLEKALETGRLCSNDPICASHEPGNKKEGRFLHGAACHGCLLIAETSCERRNEFLDRAMVVNTVEGLGSAFFPDELY